jgi:cold shock protein
VRYYFGHLKFFNLERGYGFSKADAPEGDHFHISRLEKSGIDAKSLKKGQRLKYQLEPRNGGKTMAVNIELID